MSDFSFSATAKCNKCGAYLSASDESCDHDGKLIEDHVFRRLSGGRDSITGVKSANGYKWQKLKEKIGDDWIAYQYLGPRDSVTRMLTAKWDSIEELPMQEMSLDAPKDLSE